MAYSIQQIQMKVEDVGLQEHAWQVLAIGYDTWVIIRVPHPPRLQDDLEDLCAFRAAQRSRGGARQQRRLDQEMLQRQAMISWAHTKMIDYCPSIDDRLLKTILKDRTVSAILHSRSEAQVVHVTIAALRGNGLPEQAQRLERINATARPQQPQQENQETAENDTQSLQQQDAEMQNVPNPLSNPQHQDESGHAKVTLRIIMNLRCHPTCRTCTWPTPNSKSCTYSYSI